MNKFFIKPSEDEIVRALESWQWLPIKGKKPFLVTAFGDVFLSGDERIWFLDTLEGELKDVCGTEAELHAILQTEEGENDFLLAGFVERAEREGMILGDGECYDFTINPVLGGEVEFENVQVQNFVAAINIAGQIHQIPPGTKISRFTVDGKEP